MVETSTPGYEATKIHGKLGIRASNTAEVNLNNVEVPTENLIGQEKRGFYQLMDFFNKTRNHVAAQGVGVAQGALEMAISHVKKRKAFRGTLSQLQGVQFIIAEMATRIEAARSLYWRSAYLLDHGKLDPSLISMAKWFAGDTAVYVANQAGGATAVMDILPSMTSRDFIGMQRSWRFMREPKRLKKLLLV